MGSLGSIDISRLRSRQARYFTEMLCCYQGMLLGSPDIGVTGRTSSPSFSKVQRPAGRLSCAGESKGCGGEEDVEQGRATRRGKPFFQVDKKR